MAPDPLDRLRAICLRQPEATERFFRPPYVGVKGWLGVYLDVDDVDWEELEQQVAEAYRLIDDSGRGRRRAQAAG